MKMRIELTWTSPGTAVKPAGYRIGVTVGNVDKVICTFGNGATNAVIYMHLELNVVHAFWVTAFDRAGNESSKTYIKNAYAPST